MKDLKHYLTESRLPDEALKLNDDGSYANPPLAANFYESLAAAIEENKYLFEMVHDIEDGDLLREVEDGEHAMKFVNLMKTPGLDLDKVVNGLNNYADHLGK